MTCGNLVPQLGIELATLGSDSRESYSRKFPVLRILRQRVIWQPYFLPSLSS